MFVRRFMTCSVRTRSYMKSLRTIHDKSHSLCEVNEIEIPVPWGKVTGKLWGTPKKQPILAMHGWQDNAASFDCLAPLIVKSVPVLAIDLPGHGLSSWLPPGIMYTELIYLLLIKRIKKYFGWEKLKIIAHSLSTMPTYWYAATFPMELQYVIGLDYYKFPSADGKAYASNFANAINSFLQLEDNKKEQPSYTESDIIEKRKRGSFPLDEATCKILMNRGTIQTEDGRYILNRDPRIRVIPMHTIFGREQLEEFAELIRCPYLVLRAKESFYIEKEEDYQNALKIMRVKNDVYIEEVPGTHYFHLTHPEHAAAIINPFLKKYD